MHSIWRVEALSVQLPVVFQVFQAGIEHLGATEATVNFEDMFAYKQVHVMQLSDKKRSNKISQ